MPDTRGAGAPVTLHDVAREAGVSLATASRALNGSTRKVADSYRERVLAAAAKLNYTPNLSAQAVAKGRSNTVGLLVGDISDPYFSSIASGAIAAAGEASLVVTIAVTGRDPERELEIVRALRGQRPRTIILAGSRFADAERDDDLVTELTSFQSTGGRVVFISQGELPFDTVALDNRDGARRLAIALAELGYASFAVVSGPDDLITASDRLSGFVEGLGSAGIALPAERVVHAEFTRDGGYAGTQELLSRGIDGLEIVFAVSDVMAMGAVSALRDAGVVPGEGVAVAGFDDIPTVRDITPPLTTVSVPLEEIGRRAVELALRETGSEREIENVVEGTVVVRESTPRLR